MRLYDIDTNYPVEAKDSTVMKAASYTAPDNTGFHNWTGAHKGQLPYLDAAVSSRSTYSGGAVASVTAPVTVGTNNDKTGYSLASAPLLASAFGTWTAFYNPIARAIGSPMQAGTAVGVTGDFSATMKSSLNAATPTVTAVVGPVTLAASQPNYAPATQSSVTSGFSNTSGIIKRNSGASGGPGASAIVVPANVDLQNNPLPQGSPIHIRQAKSGSIPYSLGQNITGWTVWFAAKSHPTDSTFAVSERQITSGVSSASTGSGVISLSTSDTNITPSKYVAEVEIRNGSTISTAFWFYLYIDAAVMPD